jgi:hypothetical protein
VSTDTALELCECGMLVMLTVHHEGDEHRPLAWKIEDPKEMEASAAAADVPRILEGKATIEEVIAWGVRHQEFEKTRIAIEGFKPTITCECGRTYRALTLPPWIELVDDEERQDR